MLFNSPEFIVFLVLVYCAYIVLPFRAQNYMLLGASYIFYGWWDVRFLFLVALSTTVDFWVGLVLANGRLSGRERFLPAAFLTASAVVFLGLDWSAVWSSNAEHRSFIQFETVGWIIGGCLLFLGLMSAIYRLLSGMGERGRLPTLMVSITTQIGLLAVFKYYNFFVDSFSAALRSFGLPTSDLTLSIILPVGISFYTFQSLSYTFDIYRRQLKPTSRFWDFALFVGYFPQLQAGPIERAKHLLPQLANPRRISLEQTARGLFLILQGFFKKVAIADGVAPIVNQVFGSPGVVSWADVAAGTVLFAVQIYCDFSGYTDIARGISKLLGIEMILNFNLPYFSSNPQEFWRRWHISLSSWMRDYLYVPLGGNQGGLGRVCRNLMITMLLGGLWHGAAWNFVLWGFYQGVLLCIYRIWQETSAARIVPHYVRVPRWLCVILFFFLVCYGWLLFRAQSLAQIWEFTSILIFDFGNMNYGLGMPRFSALLGIALLLPLELLQFKRDDQHFLRSLPSPLQGLVLAAIMVITLMGMSNEPAQFIYFQF